MINSNHLLKILLAFILIQSNQSFAAMPLLDALLRPAQYDDMTISPDGKYLAATYMLKDRSVLAIVERATMAISGRIDPGQDGYIESVSWANNERLFVTASKRFGQNEQPWLLPTVYSTNPEGRSRSRLSAEIIDLLVHDDEHILIRRCVKQVESGCMTEARRIGVKLKGSGERVAKGPHPNSMYLADNGGRVRFAWGWDSDDRQWLSLFRGEGSKGTWSSLNDEEETGVEVVPIGTSADNRFGYLLSEKAEGPDAIESFDFQTGERKVVLRHANVDPVRILWSADGEEPIGAVLNTPIPTLNFWNNEHPDVIFMREIEKAFPGELALVTSFTRDGEYAVVTVMSDRDPGRFYLIKRSSGEAALLNKRRPWLDPLRMGRTMPVSIKSRDGIQLTGFVTYPPGLSERSLPMVVLPHGGPYEISDGWLFNEDTQAIAVHGYAVLRINFRGSGGYGRRFVELGMKEWGRKMQDDLTDATRWAINEGIADPSRICIYGASYGGYAALMGAVREPELYQCAIAAAAPTDLDLMWRWGDIQRSRSGENYLKRALGSDPADLARRSPARRAAEIKADVMLIHGGRDFRVSPEHSRAMRAALDAAGKEYEGYFPSFEAHGIHGSENRVEYYTRILKFLDSSIGDSR